MCTCGKLMSRVNERPTLLHYSGTFFWIQGPERCQLIIYYCPWCGSELPKNFHDSKLAPSGEYLRLCDLASSVRAKEDCLALFGEPDYDKPLPNELGMPSGTQNIEYYGISTWYTVEFYITGADCRFVVHAKPIPLQDDAEHNKG